MSAGIASAFVLHPAQNQQRRLRLRVRAVLTAAHKHITLSTKSHEGSFSCPLLSFLLQPPGMEDISCQNKPLIVCPVDM